jgi:hypothetical protein
MTTEKQDALVGRMIRESKAAEDNLARLLITLELRAAEINKLTAEIIRRVGRAKRAGEKIDVAPAPRPGVRGVSRPGITTGIVAQDVGIKGLRDYANAVDLDALAALDTEVSNAVALVLELRHQKRRLGI